MAIIRRAGFKGSIEGRASIVIDRINGDSVRWVWKGLYTDLEATMTSLLHEDASITQAQLDGVDDSVLGTLTIIKAQSLPDGTTETPVDTVELNWYRRERSFWFAPSMSSLDYGDRGKILHQFKRFEDGDITIPPVFHTGAPADDLQVSNATAASEAFGILVIGDEYAAFVGTLIWTRAVSQQYATAVGSADVNKVHKTATLQAYLTAKGVLIPVLFSLAAITPPLGTAGTAYTVGWMKTEASVNIAANGKALLREVWEYYSYNNFLYTVI